MECLKTKEPKELLKSTLERIEIYTNHEELYTQKLRTADNIKYVKVGLILLSPIWINLLFEIVIIVLKLDLSLMQSFIIALIGTIIVALISSKIRSFRSLYNTTRINEHLKLTRNECIRLVTDYQTKLKDYYTKNGYSVLELLQSKTSPWEYEIELETNDKLEKLQHLSKVYNVGTQSQKYIRDYEQGIKVYLIVKSIDDTHIDDIVQEILANHEPFEKLDNNNAKVYLIHRRYSSSSMSELYDEYGYEVVKKINDTYELSELLKIKDLTHAKLNKLQVGTKVIVERV